MIRCGIYTKYDQMCYLYKICFMLTWSDVTNIYTKYVHLFFSDNIRMARTCSALLSRQNLGCTFPASTPAPSSPWLLFCSRNLLQVRSMIWLSMANIRNGIWLALRVTINCNGLHERSELLKWTTKVCMFE